MVFHFSNNVDPRVSIRHLFHLILSFSDLNLLVSQDLGSGVSARQQPVQAKYIVDCVWI